MEDPNFEPEIIVTVAIDSTKKKTKLGITRVDGESTEEDVLVAAMLARNALTNWLLSPEE